MSQKEQEFLSLIRENQGILIKVSRMYMDAPEDREDLEQEIIFQLRRSYDRYKGDSKFST